MCRTSDQVVLEINHTLSVESAQEIKTAWETWQAVAKRYSVSVRPVDGTLVIPGYDVKRRETSRA